MSSLFISPRNALVSPLSRSVLSRVPHHPDPYGSVHPHRALDQRRGPGLRGEWNHVMGIRPYDPTRGSLSNLLGNSQPNDVLLFYLTLMCSDLSRRG